MNDEIKIAEILKKYKNFIRIEYFSTITNMIREFNEYKNNYDKQ